MTRTALAVGVEAAAAAGGDEPGASSAALRARLVGAVALLAAVGVFVWVWFAYLPAFNSPHTAVAGVTVPPWRAPSPQLGKTGRSVFMVVDGLGWDQAQATAELAPLRELGVARKLDVEFPSYTYPALTSLVTGVEPRDSGVRLNGDWEGAVGLDSVPRIAGAAGMAVEVRSRGWKPFEELMRPPALARIVRGRLQRVLSLQEEELRHSPEARDGYRGQTLPQRELHLEYVEEVDHHGHEVGTRHPDFVRARAFAGAVVARRLAALDLSRDTLVVVSDHGHRPEGGHGGVEPDVLRACFFAAGAGVRRGVQLPARPMRDVAATLALLTDLPPPATSTGRPMVDILEGSDGGRAQLFAGPFRQQAAWLCALHAGARGGAPSARCAEVEPMAGRLERGEAAALPEAERLADALWASRIEAELARAAHARARRLFAVGATLALLLGLVAWRGRSDLRAAGTRAAWAPLLFLVVHCALLGARGYRPTFSALPPMSDFVRDTFAAGAIAATLVVLVAARGAAALGVGMALLSIVAVYALLAATVGSDPRVLPDPLLGVLAFHGAPAVLFASLAALAASVRARRQRRAVTPGA